MDLFWDAIIIILGYEISIMDIIDILLVTFLIYKFYKLVNGTAAINIFLGLAAIYVTYNLVDLLRMKLLSQILGGFIGVGVIMLVILFQQELRRFLIMIGRTKLISNKDLLRFKLGEDNNNLDIKTICKSCEDLSKNKTGAILVITRTNDLASFNESGVQIDAKITRSLIKSIFFKNGPLHDGAVIIRNNRIVAARCILPITNNPDFPQDLGMRHRAATGISEDSDALVIIVSEQNGKISLAEKGNLKHNCTIKELEELLQELENIIS